MIIGGLSEQEVEKITKSLERENIEYEVLVDKSIIDANSSSMEHNLRHLNSPSISTHILSIKLKDNAFELMSNTLKDNLLKLGISPEIPSELEFEAETPELIQNEMLKGNKRLVGHNFLHQIFIAIGAFLIYTALKYFF